MVDCVCGGVMFDCVSWCVMFDCVGGWKMSGGWVGVTAMVWVRRYVKGWLVDRGCIPPHVQG